MPGFASDLPKMWYVIGDEDSFMCLNATSDPPQQEQDDQDQKDQSDSAAGIGSPGLTVGPGGQGSSLRACLTTSAGSDNFVFRGLYRSSRVQRITPLGIANID